MSAQTGAVPPSGPVSQRFVDRARFRVDRFRTQPNPVWIRELRQSARLGRTPIILMMFTVLMTLLIATIGGLVSGEYSPATTGIVIFQVFFSLAWFVVTLAGPAVAANSIASEREGRTWEAVILTGLPPGTIARGKFLGSFTAVGAYIVMLAPVGALSFLFGGVTATEVVVAFAFLFLIALLSVAFGLAISSKMGSLRGAIVVTLLLSFPISTIAFSTFGPGFSVLAHKAWPGVSEGPPVWLPTAYELAPFDLSYVVYLIVVPIIGVTLPAWFLYEVTIANLTSATDDRTTGLKRWFLVALPILALLCALPPWSGSLHPEELLFVGLSGLFLFLVFAVFLFLGDPIGPSRRVLARYDETDASPFRRFLGPGVMRSSTLLLVAGALAIALVTGAGVLAMRHHAGSSHSVDFAEIALFDGYVVAFFAFVVGVSAFTRSRSSTPAGARAVVFALLLALAIGPWIVAGMAGVLANGSSSARAMLVAAPSPFFAFYVVKQLHKADGDLAVSAAAACSVGWAAIGLILLGAARRRCDAIIRKHDAMLADSERILAAEDAAHEAANAPAEAEPAPVPAEEAPATSSIPPEPAPSA